MEQNKKASVALAIACVDWRMHHPDSNFMKALYDYVQTDKIYVVTYPGPDGLCDSMPNEGNREALAAVIRQTREVLKNHGATNVTKVLISHTECAGHGVVEEQHCKDSIEMAKTLSEELELEVPFTPLLAKKGSSDLEWSITAA